jgi:hypothetical protein
VLAGVLAPGEGSACAGLTAHWALVAYANVPAFVGCVLWDSSAAAGPKLPSLG